MKNLYLLFILLLSQSLFCQINTNDESQKKISLQVCSVVPNQILNPILDSVSIYNLEGAVPLDEVFYYISVKQDSSGKLIEIKINVDFRDKLADISIKNIAGAIKRDKTVFVLMKENSEMVSSITDQLISLDYIGKEQLIFDRYIDGPVWIYIYNKCSKEIKLWKTYFLL